MNADIKKKWVTALRSGTYTKGRHFLRMHEKYCCLGVLCDLHRQETGGQWGKCMVDPYAEADTYFDEKAELPAIVSEWAGLSLEPVVATENEDNYLLVELNDGVPSIGLRVHSFKEIADLIEQQL